MRKGMRFVMWASYLLGLLCMIVGFLVRLSRLVTPDVGLNLYGWLIASIALFLCSLATFAQTRMGVGKAAKEG